MALCFRVCAALLAVAGVISSTGSVAAQRILDGTPGVQIQVQTGYGFTGGANYRLLGPGLLPTDTVWVPLFITLSNNSATDINSGRLSVLDSSSPAVNNVQFAPVNFTLDVSLPAGAHKQVEMYVPAQDIGSSQLQVNLTNGNTTLASQQVSGQLQPGGALSIGVLSDDTATRTLLHSLTIGATTPSVAQFGASTPLDTLPQALSNFDIIVASNYSSDNLTSGQLAALRSWIQAGGTFLVAGGPDLLKTVRHLSRDLLPVVPNVAGPTAVDSNVAELAAFGGAVQGGGGPIEYSVARALPGAQVRLAHNGVPLIVNSAGDISCIARWSPRWPPSIGGRPGLPAHSGNRCSGPTSQAPWTPSFRETISRAAASLRREVPAASSAISIRLLPAACPRCRSTPC